MNKDQFARKHPDIFERLPDRLRHQDSYFNMVNGFLHLNNKTLEVNAIFYLIEGWKEIK